MDYKEMFKAYMELFDIPKEKIDMFDKLSSTVINKMENDPEMQKILNRPDANKSEENSNKQE